MAGKGRLSSAFKKHMESRMGSFKRGTMHSRVKHTGPVVEKESQAQAIALSEAREKGLKGAPPAKRGHSSGNPNVYDHIAKM